MSARLAITLWLCCALTGWSAATASNEYLNEGGVLHQLPPPKERFRTGNTARRSGRAPGDDRPNFVIFFPDETRAESISAYGHPFVKTPNFDALAQQGTIFKEAHVLHTQCAPSRCAIVTGRYMHVLGHRTQDHLVRDYEPNYFRILKDSGYHVLWHGKNDMFSQKAFNHSVSDWDSTIGVSQGHNAFSFGEPGYYSFKSTASDKLGNSTKNGDYNAVVKALQFMNSKPPEPFLIFLPGIGSHPPYGAPLDYQNMYNFAQVHSQAPLRPPNQANKPKYHTGIIKYRNLESFNQTFFEEINAIYLGRVSYVDWILGQLMKGIDASPMASKTSLFVSSDHGDFAGDFHLVEKWPGGMDDILTRVPMLARIPGGKAGLVVNEPINTFDMMETIADMAGVNVTHTRFAKSFLPQLKGAGGDPNRTVYSEGGFLYHREIEPFDPDQEATYKNPQNLYYPRGQEEALEGIPRAVMAKNMNFKLVFRADGVPEFYDLKADPRELTNQYDNTQYTEVRDKMLMDLLEWYVKTGDVTPLAEDPRGAPPPPS